MNPAEISKILNEWASALKIDEEGRKRRFSLSDLVRKYSQDVRAEEAINGKRSVRPWSREDFTSRLLTFHHSATWFAKPDAISPLRCASYGWCNYGIDRLHCWSCASTLVHSKEDQDGRDLLELLRTGHSSHCGWTNNFCSEELLTFPARSSEMFNEEFLLRLRTILLSITEFARNTCETVADKQTIEDIRSSAGNNEAESCSSIVQKLSSSRMQVLIGAEVLNSASELASWLMRDQTGNVIELPLLAASSSACRSRIAATVEIISVLLSRCSGGNIVLTAGDTSGLLSAILSLNGPSSSHEIGIFGEENRASEDVVTARQAVKMSVLLAICGWNPVHSTGTSADLSVRAYPTATTSSSPGAVSAVASSSLSSFRCEWCGRSFPLSYLLSSPTDPLFQHRAFCLWAHSSGVSGVDSQLNTLPGWQQCASSVNGYSSSEQSERCDISNSSASSSRRESASGDTEGIPGSGSKKIARKDTPCGDAEKAYKKIKSVIDSAALPILNLNGRLSI